MIASRLINICGLNARRNATAEIARLQLRAPIREDDREIARGDSAAQVEIAERHAVRPPSAQEHGEIFWTDHAIEIAVAGRALTIINAAIVIGISRAICDLNRVVDRVRVAIVVTGIESTVAVRINLKAVRDVTCIGNAVAVAIEETKAYFACVVDTVAVAIFG